MSHERLKNMKENLMSCIEGQLCNIYEADCEELGEAIDMLKDLEEALYYCTITEAMEGKKSNEQEQMYARPYYPMYSRDMGNRNSYRPMEDGVMWDRGNSNGSASGGSNSSSNGSSSSYMMMRDPLEGRSPENRRMYLEAKHNGVDKNMQLKELDKYMQELTNDMVDLIQEASPEEKQYLEKKIAGLAAKIGQMK